MSAAAALGYVPAGTYAETVAAEIDWLTTTGGPADTEYFAPFFDYAAEDAYLAAQAAAER